MVHFQKFGRYEILRKLSRSMTDVYLARDSEKDRLVVLKLIEHSRDDFTQIAIEAERRGAQLQQQLHQLDKRILEIFDFGGQMGCFYVAMEYFEGKTLAEILQIERKFTPKRAAQYAAEICSQLRVLHSFVSDVNGRRTAVIHGDIKPSNVQIGAKDELRLLDFGIAKVITFTHNLTHHNLGSPSYCSPERISKSQVDQNADLWAVGVTLYEMIAGAPPYQAESTRKLENLIQSRRPPRALPENCPAPLKAIVTKALTGEIERRYESAEKFESDLRAFLQDRQTVADRERPLSSAAWNANATIERRPAEGTGKATAVRSSAPPRAAKKIFALPNVKWNDFGNVAIALLAGILFGLLILIPISYYYRLWRAAAPLHGYRDYAHDDLRVVNSDWDLYQQLKKKNSSLLGWSPVRAAQDTLRTNLQSAAENIIDRYHNSSDAKLRDFDWRKATLCLRHVLDLDPANTKAKAELALSEGYAGLVRSSKYASYQKGADSFRKAESYQPRWADPHLALARVDIYGFHNVGAAIAEFHQASQLGYKVGPREADEEADGYMYRAESSLLKAKQAPLSGKQQREKWLEMARADMERALNLYEPIAGFSNVSEELDQLQQDRLEQVKLQTEDTAEVNVRPRVSPKKLPHVTSKRRWQ